ncbi:MAG: pyruvate:ferredoxin (flavodoxin) oxidoreductase, partial [Candidatus Woesearchaeota archaeon]
METSNTHEIIDGNAAAAKIAYEYSEVAAIYPITPSSPMGELADLWASNGKKNLFGKPLKIAEMQSEAGAAGAIHGSLSAGALTTTFTASQGLLLMMPNMFKIAGEMLPTVFHVAARSLAYQSLSIFGDHSDVMAVRGTGFALIAASNIQEVQDLAAISHTSTINASIPFLNFFDGFRTSHELQKIKTIPKDTLKELLNEEAIIKFKQAALNPDKPYAKVGAQNPDVYFQGREVANKYYDAVPEIVITQMTKFKEKTGREYDLTEYYGAKDAEKIIIAMGSATETIKETIDYLNAQGERVGLLKIIMYRPFPATQIQNKMPNTVKKIAVLDRTKEAGSIGEPLYLDVVAALKDKPIKIIGGRYGLSSKEFTPSMIQAVYEYLDDGTHDFTVGINDDVTGKSIKVTKQIYTEPKTTINCKFWGYGSDGTVSANKNSIKIIGEATDKQVQAYFSYDSKKSGGVTVSHLRFGDDAIRSQYLITRADFIALHKPSYIGQYDILDGIKENGTFLINSPWTPEEVFENLTEDMQNTIIQKNIKVYTINATEIAQKTGLRNKINTVMQTAFFKLANIIPVDDAIKLMKEHIEKQFKAKGPEIVQMNHQCIDNTLNEIYEVKIQKTQKTQKHAQIKKLIPDTATKFEKNVIEKIMRQKGDEIPVSNMTLNGKVPTGTTKIEKRGVALEIPRWKHEKCIQCGLCSFVCPHTAIRMKQIKPEDLTNAPENFITIKSNTKTREELLFRVQVYPEDCIGCKVCVDACPVKEKALEMVPIDNIRAEENKNLEHFEKLPYITDGTKPETIKGSQFLEPYFEFSGACGGCGETPYVKLATQLFGDRMIIANATGCSSIFGGTFPTIPYSKDKNGRGPAWANSLFEDNAEYGYGMRLAVDENRETLKLLLEQILKTGTTHELQEQIQKILENWNKTDIDAKTTRDKILELLPDALSKVYGESEPILKKINELKEYILDKSLWIFGGDGWAYDIGFGGLDHVLAQGQNVNVLVLDTEVYSNTGGQASKATPRGATAKFAMAGKQMPKKNLGLMLTSYGYIYVASVNLGANKAQVIKALKEAE